MTDSSYKQEGDEMNIIKDKSGQSLTLTLVGRLDTNAAPVLEEELFDSLEGVTELIFECRDLEYLTSAGIRVLVAAQKEMNDQGTMVLRNVIDEIMNLFKMTALDEVFTFE